MNIDMRSPVAQSSKLLLVIAAVIFSGFTFAYFQHQDRDSRISFTLTGPGGETITERGLGGKWMLVYFGFTSCADICPTQTAKVAQTLRLLENKQLADKIAPIFISVDYQRDTAESINRYLDRFDHRLIGLTGDKVQLDSVTREFHTDYDVISRQDGAPGEFDVVHSSMTYLVDPFGKIVDRLAFNYRPDFLAQRIAGLI